MKNYQPQEIQETKFKNQPLKIGASALNHKKSIILIILLMIFWTPISTFFKILWEIFKFLWKYLWVIIPAILIIWAGFGIRNFLKRKPIPNSPNQAIKQNIENTYSKITITNTKKLKDYQKKINEILNEKNKELKVNQINWLINFNNQILLKTQNLDFKDLIKNLNSQLKYKKNIILNKELLEKLDISTHQKIKTPQPKSSKVLTDILGLTSQAGFYYLIGNGLNNFNPTRLNFTPKFTPKAIPNIKINI